MVVLPCSSQSRGAHLCFSLPLSPHAYHFRHMDLPPCAQQRLAPEHEGYTWKLRHLLRKYCTRHSKGSYQTLELNQLTNLFPCSARS